jgi:hypothetical protein
LNRIIRRTSAPGALVLLALLLAAPVAAAEPEGVLFDGAVSVTVVDGAGGAPVPNAEVTLRAYRTDFPEDPDLALLDATADASGVATFTGVPYPDAGGPAVYLAVAAYREVESLDEDGCVVFERWEGGVDGLTSSSASGSIEVVAPLKSSSIVCHVLAGTILDGNGDPVTPAFAFVSIELPDGGGAQGFPVEVAEDGSFTQPLPAIGTFDDPAIVSLEFLSAPTRSEENGDCVVNYAERARWSGTFALADGDQLPVLELVTEEVEIGGACGGGSGGETPGGGGEPPTGGPAPTLPPTDTASVAPTRGATPGPGALVAVGLLVLGSAIVLRFNRRRVGA